MLAPPLLEPLLEPALAVLPLDDPLLDPLLDPLEAFSDSSPDNPEQAVADVKRINAA